MSYSAGANAAPIQRWAPAQVLSPEEFAAQQNMLSQMGLGDSVLSRGLAWKQDVLGARDKMRGDLRSAIGALPGKAFSALGLSDASQMRGDAAAKLAGPKDPGPSGAERVEELGADLGPDAKYKGLLSSL